LHRSGVVRLRFGSMVVDADELLRFIEEGEVASCVHPWLVLAEVVVSLRVRALLVDAKRSSEVRPLDGKGNNMPRVCPMSEPDVVSTNAFDA